MSRHLRTRTPKIGRDDRCHVMVSLTPEEAENHPYGNVITRAIGPSDGVSPDYVRLEVVDGDRFVICSDGLTKELDALNATIPVQPKHLAGVLIGQRRWAQASLSAEQYDYSDALYAVRVAAHAVGAEVEVRQAAPKGFHPGRTAEVLVRNGDALVSIGFAGELDPSLATEQDLPRRVAAFEIDLEALYAAAPDVVQASHVWIMPAATQDLSLVVNFDLPAFDLERTISEGAGYLLEAIRLVDDYRGANLPEGKKSLTFALRFRAADRTLTQLEASEARDRAVALAAERFGAALRA